MVTQKAISARIDKKLLQELDLEVAIGTGNRNRLINDAVRMYMDYLDTVRAFNVEEDFSEKIYLIDSFTGRYFRTTP